MLISRFIIIVLMLPMVPSYNSILFRPNIKHYIKLPGEAVKDEIYYLNDSTNLKSTWVKEYNDCWVYSEIEDQTEITIETYYHFRFESGADYMFKKLRKRFKYEKTDSEFFGVDEAYGGKNAILVKKDKEVLYLNFPQYFTDDELKKIIDLYIS